MQHKKLLIELIAELQKIADENPGIECTLNDQEWGPSTPKVKVAPVYINDHQQATIIDDISLHYVKNTVKEYSEITPKEMWDSFDGNTEPWKNFEQFSKSHALIKENAIKDLKDFEKAVPMVVFEA